jgi:hypothetical protein
MSAGEFAGSFARQWAPLLLTAGLLLPLPAVGPPVTVPAAPHGGTTALVASHPSDFATSANGNWTLSLPGPIGSLYPGASLGAEYDVSLRSALPGASPLSVWVPPAMITFATSSGALRVYGNWANFTFGGNGSVSSVLSDNFNLSLTAVAPATFNATNRTIFSSQLAAIMSSLPYGSVNLTVAWRWVVAGPDGSISMSPWENSSLIDPAYFASVESFGPPLLTTGGSYGVCIGGPIGGRLFSLHLEVARPYDDFVHVNYSVPAGASSACWSATVPQGIAPGPLLAHIWAYDRVTLLLYVLKLTLVNSTAGGSMTLASPGWKLAVNLSALSIGGVVLIAALVLPAVRKRTPPPRELEAPAGASGRP